MIVTTKVEQTFQCELCQTVYRTEAEAKRCESVPVHEDKGAKVGDIVRVLTGEGKGELAKVTRRTVIDKDWGHYAAKRYWHTVAVDANLINSWGSRFLTFDAYEAV
jgi:hypothetical protein